MLPIRSILFPLKVAPMSIEKNFKGHCIEKLPKLNYVNMSVFKIRQILKLQILCALKFIVFEN